MSRYKSDRQFEDDVRRVADALFEVPPGECKAQIYTKASRQIEIDGVARSRHVVHLVMATTSTRLAKVKEDCDRLEVAGEIEEGHGLTVSKWMIVESEPEGPHVGHARSKGVTLLTFKQFQERFFNGRRYLSLRKNAPFGSSRDPVSNSSSVPEDEFIEPPLTDLERDTELSFDDVITRVLDGDVIVLLGPFGSGKSLALREAWFRLRRKYLQGSFDFAPVALNLREHWGAVYLDEILRRHARSLGFEPDADLVTAYRAGLIALIVDGFDELASQGVPTLEGRNVLRQIRHDALAGVRDLLSKSMHGSGILIAGRDHYFDDRSELVQALGLRGRKIVRVRVDEFDEDRSRLYLERKGFSGVLPSWLPRKALLLGYLTRRQLLDDVLAIDGSQGQATAWYRFLELICQREADHDRSSMDAESIQRVLEHLALQVRATMTGVGPISAAMLALAYTSVAGQQPSDAVIMQLQRLPGLTERDAEPGSRSFVDVDFLEALQGVALGRRMVVGAGEARAAARFQSEHVDERSWLEPVGALAAAVSAVHLRANGWTIEGLCDVIRQNRQSQYGADLLHVGLVWASEESGVLDLRGVELEGVRVPTIDLDDLVVRGLVVRDSIVDRLIIGSGATEARMSIVNSHVTVVVGVGNAQSIPNGIETDESVDFGSFDVLLTTDAIVQLDVDARVRALLTALKKLFRQRGAGRVVGAFRRGLPQDVASFIDPVLAVLVSEGFAWKLKDVYHPVRTNARRAHRILDSPRSSGDTIVDKVLHL